jgi:Secretion system C-terminal sorting domain
MLGDTMNAKTLLSLLVVLLVSAFSVHTYCSVKLKFTSYSTRNVLQGVTASTDTVYIPGDDPASSTPSNFGMLENTINADTASNGTRNNVNRIYALNEGQIYWQNKSIDVNNPTGILTIVGVPSKFGTQKPIIIMAPVNGTPIFIIGRGGDRSYEGGADLVYGSLKIVNVHWQTQQLDMTQLNELFYCGTKNKLPQSLTIDNCFFEFSNIDIFDCTDESGAIGGWPYGAKFFIKNSYFRNLFYPGQWWGSRIFSCRHPIDTLWIENNTITTGGLTFLQQNELTDVAYINHNTIINNKKYWMLSPYHRNFFVTNNIFINQNWVGEDINVTNSGQDPDKEFMSTINIDTNNATNGLIVQPDYYAGDSTHYSPLLALNRMQVYVSNNINYYDTALINGYYKSSIYIDSALGGLPSWLSWSGIGGGPWKIENIPGEWMNTRTKALFDAYSPDKGGGFLEENTSTADPNTATPGIANATVVTAMARWNQNQWGDPKFRYPSPPLITTGYIYGDYDPTTIPGVKTEDGRGISKFTDLTENFSQSTHLSAIDGYPIGSLIWDDAVNASYIPGEPHELGKVYSHYLLGHGIVAVKREPFVAAAFYLDDNYPNPFNSSTSIRFTVPSNGRATLKVFNTLGQEVATLFDGQAAAGTEHRVQFNPSDLASGVYFSRLEFEGKVQIRKMVLLK